MPIQNVEEDHSEVLSSLASLAGMYCRLGDLQKAEEYYKEAFKKMDTKRGTNSKNPELLSLQNAYAGILRLNGKRLESANCYRDVLQAREQVRKNT